jgi:DNA-directed RNA polymerase subunit RPC12/RpoP
MSDQKRFPCSICAALLDVRETKKGKPYVICNSCGLQMFVRNGDGIRRFESLLAETQESDLGTRLARLEQRYKKECPECGSEFWAEEKLIKTSVFDGSLRGYRCPKPGCKGIVKMEVTRKWLS